METQDRVVKHLTLIRIRPKLTMDTVIIKMREGLNMLLREIVKASRNLKTRWDIMKA